MPEPDTSALDALRDEKGIIIAPNHITSLDALFVITRLPNIVCIMKAKLWDSPVFGGGSRLAGYLRNDNSSSMFRKASVLPSSHRMFARPSCSVRRAEVIAELQMSISGRAERKLAALSAEKRKPAVDVSLVLIRGKPICDALRIP